MKAHSDTTDFTHALKNGKIVYIDDVENGIKCDCVCPSCQLPLIAYNNPKNKNSHHFQHQSQSNCRNYYETMIHYLAKEIISETGKLIVPNHIFVLDNYVRSYTHYERVVDNPKEVIKPYNLIFDSVSIEVKRGAIKPDLLCFIKNKEIHIEIAVTHFIDNEKAEKIKDLGIVSLEIDLSSFDKNIQKEKLKEVLDGNIGLMKWFNNKSISLKKEKSELIKAKIHDYISQHIKEQKAYGRTKRVYNCPILNKDYDVTLANCEMCQYFVLKDKRFHSATQENYDDRNLPFPDYYVMCIGHVASDFDKLLVSYGVGAGKNRAFKYGVSYR